MKQVQKLFSWDFTRWKFLSNARNLTECWLGQTLSCSALLLIIELIGNSCLIPSLWRTRMEATQMFSVNWMHEILIKSVIYRYCYYCFHFLILDQWTWWIKWSCFSEVPSYNKCSYIVYASGNVCVLSFLFSMMYHIFTGTRLKTTLQCHLL